MVVSERFPFAAGMGLFDDRATLTKLEGYLLHKREDHRPMNNNTIMQKDDSHHSIVKEVQGGGQDEDVEGFDDNDDENENVYDDLDGNESESYSEVEEQALQELEYTQAQHAQMGSQHNKSDDQLFALQSQLKRTKKILNNTVTEKHILIREVERLNAEIEEKDRGRHRPELENRLRRAVELLKKDLTSAREKYAKSQVEARSQRSRMEHVEEKNQQLQLMIEQLQEKEARSGDCLSNYQEQLTEAREEATKLTEEVVELRERLRNAQNIANEKLSIVEKDVSHRVKEKIRLEIREATTKEVAERTEKRVRAEMQLAHDKEINILRGEFKKVFKENAVLKQKVEDSRSEISNADKLHQQVPILKDEIKRLEAELEATKDSNERMISDTETRYRNEMQAMKEQAAKEKWEHATELRRQISRERDRDVQDFTKRIEALSKQTDRLLQRAEKEKEEYADQVRQRITQEKQREIQVMMDKLAAITRESEDLLKEASKDKEAYADQIRREMTEERSRLMNKQSYRIEVLNGEKDTLLKRIDAFEQELSFTWEEQQKNIDKLKSTEASLKASEDELFRLKRTNQNLVNLLERYKMEHEEATRDFKQAKEHFRRSLLESEEETNKLKDQVKCLENELAYLRRGHEMAAKQLAQTKQALTDSKKEEPFNDCASETSSVNTILSAIEIEKARVKGRKSGLESYRLNLHRVRESTGSRLPLVMANRTREDIIGEGCNHSDCNEFDVSAKTTRSRVGNNSLTAKDELLIEVEKLNQSLKSTTAELENKESELAELRDALSRNQEENLRLHKSINELDISLGLCKKELVRVNEELKSSKNETKSLVSYENKIEMLGRKLDESNALLSNEVQISQQQAKTIELYEQEIGTLKRFLQQANDRVETRGGPDDTTLSYRDESTLEESREVVRNDETSMNAKNCQQKSEDRSLDSIETSKLNTEIKALKLTIERHKADFNTEMYRDDESIGEGSSQSKRLLKDHVRALVNQVTTLKATVNSGESTKIEVDSSEEKLKAERIEELENLLKGALKEATQTRSELNEVRSVNVVLREKIEELEKLLQEYSLRLSETSEELLESREEVASSGDSISHLKQRLERLTSILEEKEHKIEECQKDVKMSKIRLEEITDKSQKEISHLKTQLEDLTFALSQSNNELQDSKDQEKRARSILEEELVKISNESSRLHLEKEHLEMELRDYGQENANLKTELGNLKNKRDLVRVKEDEIQLLRRKLDEANAQLSSEVQTSQQQADSIELYELENATLKRSLQQAIDQLETSDAPDYHDETIVEESREGALNHENSMNSKDCHQIEEDHSLGSSETSRLNNEIKALKSMIERHKEEFKKESYCDDESNGDGSSQSRKFLKDQVRALEDQITDLKSTVKSGESTRIELQCAEETLKGALHEMTERVEELENLLKEASEETTETTLHLKEVQSENVVLREKTEELEKLLQEYSLRLSETSDELLESRREITSSGDSFNQLKQRLEKLTFVLEEKERIIEEYKKDMENSKNRLEEMAETSQKATADLKTQLEGLNAALSQSNNELQASKDQEQQSRAFLEEELLKFSNESCRLQVEREHLEKELRDNEEEINDLRKELLHSKRLFGEALAASEKTIFDLNQRIQEMTNVRDQSQRELQDTLEVLEDANKSLKEALVQSDRKSQEMDNHLQELLMEKRAILSQVSTLQTSLENASDELEKEKAKYDKEIRNLRNEVANCNEENLDISKELQHSRQLFREALIAWRVETRDLTQQLGRLKGTDQSLATSSYSRDSFSAHSSLQNQGDSTDFKEISKVQGDDGVAESWQQDLPDFEDTDEDGTEDSHHAESPGRAQASRFFASLLNADMEEDEIMPPVHLQENVVQMSMTDTINTVAQGVDGMKNTRDRDHSVTSLDSQSILTTTSLTSTQRKKAVRWMDSVVDKPLHRTASSSQIVKSDGRYEEYDRVSETRQLCDEREPKEDFDDKILQGDEIRSTGSHRGGSFSTEDDSLRGSKLLPPKPNNRIGDYPIQSNRFQVFRRKQQQQNYFQRTDSRDDSVQSRESDFFSYTNSSTSGHSREYSQFSEHSNSSPHDRIRDRYQDGMNQSRSQMITTTFDNDDSTIISGLSASSHHSPRHLKGTQTLLTRAWSSRHMQLFSEQRSTMADIATPMKADTSKSSSRESSSSRSRRSIEEAIEAMKPIPYDEQKEQLQEEEPFDQANRKKLLPSYNRDVVLGQLDTDSVSQSLAETSTLANSESATLKTDWSQGDTGGQDLS